MESNLATPSKAVGAVTIDSQEHFQADAENPHTASTGGSRRLLVVALIPIAHTETTETQSNVKVHKWNNV